eukprot:COSAG06_NODE_24002_length_675_cov_1.201389_1_plen_82_part_01
MAPWPPRQRGWLRLPLLLLLLSTPAAGHDVPAQQQAAEGLLVRVLGPRAAAAFDLEIDTDHNEDFFELLDLGQQRRVGIRGS